MKNEEQIIQRREREKKDLTAVTPIYIMFID